MSYPTLCLCNTVSNLKKEKEESNEEEDSTQPYAEQPRRANKRVKYEKQ